MAAIGVGIGGWNFPPWRGSFYPAGLPRARELEYASRELTSIEINGTFYRHQVASSFAAWAAATPKDFVFAVKAHRATTHGKVLALSGPAIERFLKSGISALGRKLGPILWQFPTTRRFDPEQSAAFLGCLPPRLDGLKLRHAIEARHPSFDDAAWIALLRSAGVASVIVDSDKQALRGDRTADFCYLRLQRNAADAPEGYDAAALDAWADRLLRWRAGRNVTDLELRARATLTESTCRVERALSFCLKRHLCRRADALICRRCLSNPAPTKGRGGVDCFVYFISGDKARAPDAARAMIERVS